MCEYCEVNYFVRVHKNDADILPYVKKFLCAMTEKFKQDTHT